MHNGYIYFGALLQQHSISLSRQKLGSGANLATYLDRTLNLTSTKANFAKPVCLTCNNFLLRTNGVQNDMFVVHINLLIRLDWWRLCTLPAIIEQSVKSDGWKDKRNHLIFQINIPPTGTVTLTGGIPSKYAHHCGAPGHRTGSNNVYKGREPPPSTKTRPGNTIRGIDQSHRSLEKGR